MSLYTVSHQVSRFFFRIVGLVMPQRYYGQENIPAGSAVLCANHTHNSDPFYIAYAFDPKDQMMIMGKEEIRHFPLVGPLLDKLGFMIWVRRGRSDVGAIKNAMKALKNGQKLMIFPEGTRHDDIGEGKHGAAMLALRTGSPILPIYISPVRKWFHPIRVYVGKPFTPAMEEGKRPNPEDYERITAEIMSRIRAIRDQHQEELG